VSDGEITIAELFAGVGGFRLGLEGYRGNDRPGWDLPAAGPFRTAWANQWEPPGTEARQFAARCYEAHFGEGSVVNEDIAKVLDEAKAGRLEIPDVDMVVGGFPCQDYSVAKPLSQAGGIEGKKGVLWWDIYRFLEMQVSRNVRNARWCLFENVDRLLKSPAKQRGRDFAIILSCLASLGYSVEWRVVNSAEYGFPQRRKRTYILAERCASWDLVSRLEDGVMARALPMEAPAKVFALEVPEDPYEVTQSFNEDGGRSPFHDAGVMVGRSVVTCNVTEAYEGKKRVLGDVLVPEDEVPESFYVPEGKLQKWEYLKGAKSEYRENKRTGFEYHYSEGRMAFPDLLTNQSRTILTGEGGSGASRFKHVILVDGRYRRLVPDELDQLQGFPRGWTDTGMSDGNRAFCMGNALVVGIPHLIGKTICEVEKERGQQ
jgi:DNA (cytosine-5)-methyltransferase 1